MGSVLVAQKKLLLWMATSVDCGAVLFFTLLVAGCAGTAPRPVIVYQIGDDQLTCETISLEGELILAEIEELLPESAKTAERNRTLGVTGIFLLVPLLFMDLSDAEQIEANALRLRYNHLLEIGDGKDCGFDEDPIAPFTE